MHRKVRLALPVVCVVIVGACSATPQMPLSPTATELTTTFLNPDGSTMKVTAPRDLGPNGITVDTRRPTLGFTNAIGTLQQFPISHELEIRDPAGAVVYAASIAPTTTSSSHTVELDLAYGTTFSWQVRARNGNFYGPWSGVAHLRTPDPPPPPPPAGPAPTPAGTLPFPVPAECGPFGPGNRIACVLAVAAQSVEWQGCAAGIGVRCHRFTRQVVFALRQADANWQMIMAAPGGHACNCSGCGPSDGGMFREDTTVYARSSVFDMITGAGGPSPGLSWSGVGSPRPGDLPNDAPLCVP